MKLPSGIRNLSGATTMGFLPRNPYQTKRGLATEAGNKSWLTHRLKCIALNAARSVCYKVVNRLGPRREGTQDAVTRHGSPQTLHA